MSKGQRGNRESQKSKQVRHAAAPGVPPPAVPTVAGAILDRQQKK